MQNKHKNTIEQNTNLLCDYTHTYECQILINSKLLKVEHYAQHCEYLNCMVSHKVYVQFERDANGKKKYSIRIAMVIGHAWG